MIKKPKILSSDRARNITIDVLGLDKIAEIGNDDSQLAFDIGLIQNITAEAQNDYCYKEMLRQFLGMHNMRDEGGVEPEWAMSNKDYQALQGLEEG